MKKRPISSPSPSQRREIELAKAGYAVVCGLDEAGRGAWAGPVVAAAVVMPLRPRLHGVRDSKQISLRKREDLAQRIRERALYSSVAFVPAQQIDKIGIAAANELAMRHAVEQLGAKPDFSLVDAFSIAGIPGEQEGIIRGDSKVYSIAAASILAKVARDNMMIDFAQTYPEYGFEKHKGYGTAAHRKALMKHGITPLHRRSFQPMSEMV